MSEPQPWVLPNVDGPVVGRRRAEDLNLIEREAWEQGFSQGRAAGTAAAQAARERTTALEASRTDPQQVIAVIRETLALLPVAAREVRLHLHPEDAALVRERLAEPNAERAWSVVEDPVIGRGGCRLTSENSSIDAQVESRLGAAIAAALGEERTAARGATP